MGVYTITFSPSGGVKAVADTLASGLAGNVRRINLLDRKFDFASVCLTAEDVCVAAVPAFGGRAPGVAMERLGKLAGNGAVAIPVAVYGNRAIEDTLVELADTLEAAGFRICAGVSAVAEHSIMRQFATGRPDEADRQELKAFAEEIRARLDDGEWEPPVLPGSRPYKEIHRIAMDVQARDGCIGCGVCADHCPVGAIPMQDPGQTDPEICISCMGCVEVCPMGARGADPGLLKASIQRLSAVCEGRKPNELFL